jgi:endonuclease/exonuclease/phosphatase family metal-dependent hydrolase
MYRIVLAVIGLVFVLWAPGCVEPQETTDSVDNVQSPFGSGGKGDTLGPIHLDGEQRDGQCDEGREDLDPDCFIRIASWNIQDFGVKKARDPLMMVEIADVLRRFDVVAIQEVSNIRERHDLGCERNAECPDHENCGMIRDALERELNEGFGRNYAFVFSDQTRHERYLFIYDTEQVELIHDQLMEDPGDSEPICAFRPESTGSMARQPHLGVFQAKDFSFAVLNAHTSPTRNRAELDALAAFEREVRQWGLSDVIVAGDLNADCRYLSPKDDIDLRFDEYLWVFSGADTTVGSTDCGYDQMIVREDTLDDLTGDMGIYTDINPEMSDHYPIWAHFYIERDQDVHQFDVPVE